MSSDSNPEDLLLPDGSRVVIDEFSILKQHESDVDVGAVDRKLERALRRARAVTLPEASPPEQVRAYLLKYIARLEQTAEDESERQAAADWRLRVESATDEQLWALSSPDSP
jgi:hypothetical protein